MNPSRPGPSLDKSRPRAIFRMKLARYAAYNDGRIGRLDEWFISSDECLFSLWMAGFCPRSHRRLRNPFWKILPDVAVFSPVFF